MIDRASNRVWPWVAQLGQEKAGFYSYQWLENLAGCRVRNAAAVHPEWAVKAPEEAFRIHPSAPALAVSEFVAESPFVVTNTEHNLSSVASGTPAPRVSWLFLVRHLGVERAQLISRFRISYAPDWRSRLAFGPDLIEPISFAMDRRMLLGVKERVERAAS